MNQHHLDIVVPLGAAWGDGRHPTTQMLAQWIMESDLAKQRVLDLGCGTGLLGLIALHRGAEYLVASDYDPAAVTVCQQLMQDQGIDPRRYDVSASDLLEQLSIKQAPVDLLIANIYADLSQRLCHSPLLTDWTSPTCHLWLSGISSQHLAETVTAWQQQGWHIHRHRQEDMWHALDLRRDRLT